jgi:hypothetical protein
MQVRRHTVRKISHIGPHDILNRPLVARRAWRLEQFYEELASSSFHEDFRWERIGKAAKSAFPIYGEHGGVRPPAFWVNSV